MTTATETSKVRARLRALSASFDQLEAQLQPLLENPLPETLLGLEPLQRAKLQTVLPYAVYDLIFIYLKAQGIDPKTHPVVSELERIRQYYDKINNAENPPAKRTEVDKAAANRFIKHAINSIQWQKTAAETMQETDDTNDDKQEGSSRPDASEVTSKMLERQAYEKELKEKMQREAAGEEEEEEGLKIFDGEGEDDDAAMTVDADESSSRSGSSKGKGKEKEKLQSTKRSRPSMDPFAASGVGDNEDSSIKPKKSKKEKQKPSSSTDDLPAANSNSTSTPEPPLSSTKKTDKKKKSKNKAV